MANRKLKIHALMVVLFFTFGVWCMNFPAFNSPPLASEHTDFECSFGLAPGLTSNKVLIPSRSDGFAKGSQFWLTAGLPWKALEEILLAKPDIVSTARIINVKKVPTHLINSILTI